MSYNSILLVNALNLFKLVKILNQEYESCWEEHSNPAMCWVRDRENNHTRMRRRKKKEKKKKGTQDLYGKPFDVRGKSTGHTLNNFHDNKVKLQNSLLNSQEDISQENTLSDNTLSRKTH